jgi:hypothetical protein
MELSGVQINSNQFNHHKSLKHNPIKRKRERKEKHAQKSQGI